VDAAVDVALAVGVADTVGDGATVAVAVGDTVAVVVGDDVAVAVAVVDAVAVGGTLAVGVGVVLTVGVADIVGVGVVLAVGVGVMLTVGVADTVGVAGVVEVGVGLLSGPSGSSKRSTRLLDSSATNRLPAASIATPAGRQMPVVLGGGGAKALAHALVAKLVPPAPCPNAWSAVVSPAPVCGLGAASG
jgi:hypothetical protein